MEFVSERVESSIKRIEEKIAKVTGHKGIVGKEGDERADFINNIFMILNRRKKADEDITVVISIDLPEVGRTVIKITEEDNAVIKIKSENNPAEYHYWGVEVLWKLIDKGTLFSRAIDYFIEHQTGGIEIVVKEKN